MEKRLLAEGWVSLLRSPVRSVVIKRKDKLQNGRKYFQIICLIRGFTSKIYNEFIQLNSKMPNNLIKKQAEELNRYFSREDIQMINRDMKRCSNLLIIREIQMKTTMKYHLTPARMFITKRQKITSAGEDVLEKGTLVGCW